MSLPTSTQLYTQGTGTTSSDAFITILAETNPSPTQYHYPIGKRWVNLKTSSEWMLANFISFAGVIQGNWIELGSGGNGIRTLTGNTGGAVPGDVTANINVVGDNTTIRVAGNPSTNTLTVSAIVASNISFSAYTNTLVSDVTGDGTIYTVQFPNVRYNNGSGFNDTNGVFTAPVSGIYQFNCNLWTTNALVGSLPTCYSVSFTFNGNVTQNIGSALPTAAQCTGYYFDGFSLTQNANCTTISQSIYLSANDTTSVILAAFNGDKIFSVGTVASAFYSNFTGFLVP